MKKLLVIAGTYDSRELIERLKKYDISIIATVATQVGRELLSNSLPNSNILVGRLKELEFKEIIYSESINCVLDTSHPYACEVTNIVSNVCKRLDIPYIRYLRPSQNLNKDDFILANDFNNAADLLSNMEGNIILTTGTKNLEIFINSIQDYKQRLFVRILPTLESIRKCEQLKIPITNIIALNGKFSVSLNIELFKYCNADILVTKDSGEAGGFEQKIEAAKQLNLKILVIKRQSEFNKSISTYKEAVELVLQNLNLQKGILKNV